MKNKNLNLTINYNSLVAHQLNFYSLVWFYTPLEYILGFKWHDHWQTFFLDYHPYRKSGALVLKCVCVCLGVHICIAIWFCNWMRSYCMGNSLFKPSIPQSCKLWSLQKDNCPYMQRCIRSGGSTIASRKCKCNAIEERWMCKSNVD